MLDRIDIKVEAPRPRESVLLGDSRAKASAAILARVCAARERQLARQGKPNAWPRAGETVRHCALEVAAEELLKHAIARLSLSARAYHRVLRVARTIADLAGAGTVQSTHIAEAIQYRRLDACM